MKLHDIPTPALVVDLSAMERNIRRMAGFFAESTCKLRPHFKAHKTPAIARRQLAAGSCAGLTCATVGEAEIIVAEALTDDVLIANEVIGPGKAARVARLARQADVKVAVDSDAGLDDLTRAACTEGVEIGVLVDVNVGLPRCGIDAGAQALSLAQRVIAGEGVRLRGVMGYEGHVVAIEHRAQREAAAKRAMEPLLSTVRMIREAGLPCEIVSAGGTGTYDVTGRIEGVTEIQAGSYVLMDTAYGKLDIPFELAFTVLGTVLSRPKPEMCVADNGNKACSMDHGNPAVKGIEGASVLFLSDEHATIMLPPESTIRVGDRIALWPSHIDPTINLHDVIFAVDGDEVVEVWRVAARGYSEQRPSKGPAG
jgi:D-serine deaminase-like pyridoxal phosphate-dependent protein